ncbi:MAG: hypothetical protein ACP5XB_22810 [Isosphaeraceae bacterium]
MDQQLELLSPDPWDDPEFAQGRSRAFRAKLQARRYQRRIWTLGLIVAVTWLELLLDPMARPLVLDGLLVLAMVLSGLGVLLLAMALGMIGAGLFAVGDRVIAWVEQGSRWPEA